MTEQAPHGGETRMLPDWESGPHQKPETYEELSTQSDEKDQLPDINESLAKALEQPEQPPLELPIDASSEGNQPQYIDRAMKRISLGNELNSIRGRLPIGQKILSRIVHRPLIRQSSEIGARTFARPIGLLGGGAFAFCGSVLYLVFDKYIGAKYNFLMFVYFFIAGYALFVIGEFIGKSSSRKR